jgi:hypothetical protein
LAIGAARRGLHGEPASGLGETAAASAAARNSDRTATSPSRTSAARLLALSANRAKGRRHSSASYHATSRHACRPGPLSAHSSTKEEEQAAAEEQHEQEQHEQEQQKRQQCMLLRVGAAGAGGAQSSSGKI